MEGHFYREPERDPASEFYDSLAEYLASEIEASPEKAAEMRKLQAFVSLMQRAIPLQASPYIQDQTVHTITQALEAMAIPSAPITLAPPGRTINVGEHMKITTTYAEECWPDRSSRELALKDGEVISKDTKIGKIDIVRNFGTLDADASLMTFTKQLMRSSIESLRELAKLVENETRNIQELEAFGGTSHLARMGDKYGFTTFEIKDEISRARATAISKSVAEQVSGNNKAWKELAQNYKPAKVAFISSPNLVHLFGAEGPENIKRLAR